MGEWGWLGLMGLMGLHHVMAFFRVGGISRHFFFRAAFGYGVGSRHPGSGWHGGIDGVWMDLGWGGREFVLHVIVESVKSFSGGSTLAKWVFQWVGKTLSAQHLVFGLACSVAAYFG